MPSLIPACPLPTALLDPPALEPIIAGTLRYTAENVLLINQSLLRTSLSDRVVKAVDAKLALSDSRRIHTSTKAITEEFNLNGATVVILCRSRIMSSIGVTDKE